MDILIKNMEMPKSCYSEVYSENGYCPFHCFDYHGGSHCTISACKCLKTRRPKDCPLIPLPEHGDLIDRQKFYEKIVQHIKDTESEDFTDKEREMVQMAMKAVLYELLNECAVVLERTT